MAHEEDWAEVGDMCDKRGAYVYVDVLGDVVRVVREELGGRRVVVTLGPAEREEFQRLFMEAERQAEAHPQ